MADEVVPGWLAEAVSQERFGALVGVSQQAVSEQIRAGVLPEGAPLGEWLLAYCHHLREQAAGRSADGELARERARLAREQADRVAMENAQSRREVAPIATLEVVLGKLAGDVASTLNGLIPRIKRRLPDVPASVLAIIDEELFKIRARAAAVSLEDAEHDEGDEDEIEAAAA
jgi:phage terminase Nu1 subunit (DNA packaging protein)